MTEDEGKIYGQMIALALGFGMAWLFVKVLQFIF